MKKLLAMGIMSGTSIDSVDYALCEIAGRTITLKQLWSADFPKALRTRLHAAARGDLRSWEFAQLHHDLGRFYTEHAARGAGKPDVIGLHGQTVFHNPAERRPATFQLGEAAYLAERFRTPVINNFRAADIAAGGQGAPLATVFHEFVFAERGRHVCVNNLGGISNVTSLDWKAGRGTKPRVRAFDTGPANMLIDFAARHFSDGARLMDRDGAWAARGKPAEALLAKWLQHSYFKRKPPKSTGRELFGEPFFNQVLPQLGSLSKFDTVATFTAFTARSLALNYKLHLGSRPDKVILTGGGGANPVLVKAIRESLAEAFRRDVPVSTSEELGWPVQAIEPAAFALLAYLRFVRKPGNLPETTGASREVLCGQISGP